MAKRTSRSSSTCSKRSRIAGCATRRRRSRSASSVSRTRSRRPTWTHRRASPRSRRGSMQRMSISRR
eukprot:9217436-Alexandrium_andersonii.AAC.1